MALYRGVIGLLFILIWLALRPRGSGLAAANIHQYEAATTSLRNYACRS